jgi:hypothetical protein
MTDNIETTASDHADHVSADARDHDTDRQSSLRDTLKAAVE